jgi:hypothetical protein
LPLVMVVATAAAPRSGKGVWVSDAGHLGVRLGDRTDEVVLIGVDSSDAGPCGPQGRAYLQGLAVGRTLRVETDREAHDAAGHLLAYVYLPDGSLLNERVIAGGYARVGPMGANTAHAGVLVAAQTAARTHRLCLWVGEHKQPGKPDVIKGIRLPLGGGGGPAVPRFKNPLPPRHG